LNGTDSTQSNSLFGDALAPFIANGTASEALLDDKITRILTPYFALDQASLPSVDIDRYVAAKSTRALIREIAEGSITLLKNTDESTRGLPLNKPKDLLCSSFVLFAHR
jgi:beta-glucosidase